MAKIHRFMDCAGSWLIVIVFYPVFFVVSLLLPNPKGPDERRGVEAELRRVKQGRLCLWLWCFLAVISMHAEPFGISLIEHRTDGIWLVFRNIPSHWKLQRSSGFLQWEDMVTGHNWWPTQQLELKINSTNEVELYRVVAVNGTNNVVR